MKDTNFKKLILSMYSSLYHKFMFFLTYSKFNRAKPQLINQD